MNRNKLRALIFAALLISTSAGSFADTVVSITVAPPPLPVYTQPVCPGDGYIWTPGYWAYGPNGYYWVPGTWVLAPRLGYLWTPGYWGWAGGLYLWHGGYWGFHVGFYGGVNYGYGYMGLGYHGGYWNGGRFYYNRSVTNVNVTNIHNTYNKVVIVNNHNRSSFNGRGGIEAKPTREEMQAGHEQHVGATSTQLAHERNAGTNRALLASVNKGHPGTAATGRPLTAHANNGSVGAVHGNNDDRNLSHSHQTLDNRSMVSKPGATRPSGATKSQVVPQRNMTHPHSTVRSVHPAGHPSGGGHPTEHRGRR